MDTQVQPVIDEVGTVKIVPSPNTPVMCTSCGTIDTNTFYMKRKRGLYAMLCFRGGEGCWERSSRSLCSFIDSYGMQCQALAEYEVVSGDAEKSRIACYSHVTEMFKVGAPGYGVFPIDED